MQVVCLVVLRRCFHSRFSAQHLLMLSNQVSRVQYCVFADFCLRRPRNCPHNCPTVLRGTSYATMPSFSIVSSGSTLASYSSASQLFTQACRQTWPQSKAVRHPQSGPRWRHITVRLIRSQRAVEVPLTPQIPQSPPLLLGKSMSLRSSSVLFVLRRGLHSPGGPSLLAPGLFHHLHPLSRRTSIYYYYVTVAVPKEMALSTK